MQSQESNQTSSELLIMRRFITLRTEYGHDEVDLEMPGDQPISRLLPELLKAINWPVTEGERRIHYALRTESGHVMKDSETLDEAGVENSDTLWIMLAEPEIKVEPGKISPSTKEEYLPDEGPISGFSPVAATTPSPKDRRGTLPSPLPVGVAMNQPALVNPEGWIFILGDPPISIGRASHGKKPDVDLTESQSANAVQPRDLLLKLYDWVAGLAGDGPCPGASVRKRYASIGIYILHHLDFLCIITYILGYITTFLGYIADLLGDDYASTNSGFRKFRENFDLYFGA
jgi:uncharacterized ubiquitin-like protein YukD